MSIVDIVSIYDVIRLKRGATDGDGSVRDDRGLLPRGGQHDLQGDHAPQGEYGGTTGMAVEVEKRIPLGSGLGGGSGNAATVMKESG